MAISFHSARVAGPLSFVQSSGQQETIPLGPCFVEEAAHDSVAIFWGVDGEESAVLTSQEANVAANEGRLVMLD
jgi:hypothetical protein